MKSEELAFLHLNSDVPTNTYFIMYAWESVFLESKYIKYSKVH